MKRLYRATCTIDVLYWSETPHEDAREMIRTEIDANGLDSAIHVEEVIDINEVPYGWHHSTPWNSDDDKTCCEVLSK